MTQGRKGRYRCAVHVCVFLCSVCLCIRVCVLCICSTFAFFPPQSVLCACVHCFVSFIYSLSPACSLTTCLPTLEIEKPHCFTVGVGVEVNVALQSPGLCRNAAYSARLSRPTNIHRASLDPLSLPLPLSDTHTSLRGCIIFK